MTNRRYAAALAIAAGAILAIGSYFRPRPANRGHEATKAAPAAPQPVSRGSEMRQISDFLRERGRRAAQHLIWVPSVGATGVQWTSGQVVTISGDDTAVLQTVSTAETGLSPVSVAPEERLQQGGWLVLAARNDEGQLISTSGLLGGTAPVECGNQQLRRLLLNIPLDSTWAGGGVFDVSGLALGLVVRCGETWAVLTQDSVQRLLEGQLGEDAVTWQQFGVRVRTPSEPEQKLLRVTQPGLFISEVRDTSRAASIGILPGDLLLRSGDRPLKSAEDVLALDDSITLLRAGRRLTLNAAPTFALAAPEGTAITHVEPDSRVARASLRPGDRVLEPRLLESTRPAWVVYRRGNRIVGAMLP